MYNFIWIAIISAGIVYVYYETKTSWLKRDLKTAEEEIRSLRESEDIRLAKNPKTPSQILLQLTKSKSDIVRLAVSENPNSTWEALENLTINAYKETLQNIARHPNTAPETLLALADNIRSDVSWLAGKHPNAPSGCFETSLKRFYWKKVNGVVNLDEVTYHMPIKCLEILASDDSDMIRGAVAKSHNSPPHLLARLALDPSDWVRLLAKENPKTPVE